MIHFHDIDNKKLCKEFFNRVQFLSFAGGGAMGDAGGVIAVKSYGKVFYGNFAYEHGHELLDCDKLLDSFPILNMKVSELETKGWKWIYMGMGNNLFVRLDIFDEFWKAASSDFERIERENKDKYKGDIEVYLYQNWVDVALKVIARRKRKL